MKKIAVFLTFLLILVGCQKKDNTIYIGYLPTPQQAILAELTSQIIENQTSYHTELVKGNHDNLAEAQQIISKEYVDLLISDQVTTEKYLLDTAKYQTVVTLQPKVDTALILQKDVANLYGITTISDLAKISKYYTFGANDDFFKNQFDNLKKTYHLTFKHTETINSNEKLLSQFEDKRIDIFPSSIANQAIYKLDYVILEDDLNFFEANTMLILGNEKALKKYPNVKTQLTKLVEILDDKNLHYLNHAIAIEHQDKKETIKKFLSQHNLLKVKSN